jgi:DNA-binding PadR family transcriptional regulator
MYPFFFARHGYCSPFFGHQHFGRHHRGFQGFGFGPGQMFRGDSGRGAGGIGAGRKLGSADLQLLILAMLAEKPRHGYELIKAIGERSNGYYSPSPGMVYPALTYLEEIGHAAVELDGTKKRYSITPDGLTFLESNRAAVDTLLEQLAWIGQKMEHVRRAFGGDRDDSAEDFDAPQDRDGRGRGRGREHGHDHDFATEIRQARRNLKSALIAKTGATTDEQKRIAAILEQAAKDIRGE